MKIESLMDLAAFCSSKKAEGLSVAAIERIRKVIERDLMIVSFSESLERGNVDGWKELTPIYGIALTSREKMPRQLRVREPLNFGAVLKILHTDPQVRSGAVFHTGEGPVEAVQLDGGKKWFVGACCADEFIPQNTQVIFFQAQEKETE